MTETFVIMAALVGIAILAGPVVGGIGGGSNSALPLPTDLGSGPAGLPSFSLGGMNLNAADIAIYARQAGFAGQDLITAVAIALAESGGNPIAYNPEHGANAPLGKGSYGLWQIYLNAHPEFEGQDLYDPATNAAAAYSVYHLAGNSFRPWTTFKSGVYLDLVNEVTQQVTA